MMGLTEPASGRREELARTYLMLLVPAIRDAFCLVSNDMRQLAGMLDWSVVMEPLVPTFANALTDDELSQSIAWAEGALYKKLCSLQGDVNAKAQAGMLQAMGKLLAEES